MFEIGSEAGAAKVFSDQFLEVAAKAMAADVMSMVKADGGMHVVDTVGGCKLTLKADGGKVTVIDPAFKASGYATGKLVMDPTGDHLYVLSQ